MLTDTLQGGDLEQLKGALSALYQEQKERLTINVLTEGSVQSAGPFRSKTQFQAALRELAEPISKPSEASALYSRLGGLAPQFGSDRPNLVLIGRFPDLDPELREYAIAWTAAALHGVRASFLALGDRKPPFLDAIARLTGGAAQFESAGELGASLAAQASWIEASWEQPTVSRGFRYHRVQLLKQDGGLVMEVPAIACAPGTPAPDIERYKLLRASIGNARKLLESKDPDAIGQAREELQKSLAVNSADPEALRLAADLYKRVKDFKTAAGLLQVLAETEPDNAQLAAEIGHAHFASGDMDGADGALSRARELGYSSALLYEQLGRIRLARNQGSGALSAFDRSLQLEKKNQDLWFLQADTATKLGDRKREREALEQGLALGGEHVPRRAALVRIYLASGEKGAALKHVDAVLGKLPADAGLVRTYAGFLEQLGRPDDALRLWRKALELDPASEDAYLAAGNLLLGRKDLAGAAAVSDAGLATAPRSGRLLLLKADTLRAAGDITGARSVLRRAVGKGTDTPALVQRAAEIEDLFGTGSADLYASLSDLLEKNSPRSAEHLEALRRGLAVSIRDQNTSRAGWFSSRLRALGEPAPLVRISRTEAAADVISVPGGLEALAFIAHGKAKSPPDQFLVEYCRALIRNAEPVSSKEAETYLQSIQDYFIRLSDLAGQVRPRDNRVTITLSLADKNKRRETERILELLGWKLRVSKEKVTVEAGQKSGQGKRQETSSALAIDEVAMQEALQAGKPFPFEIPYELAPAALGEKAWRAEFYPKQDVPGGLAGLLARDIRLAKLYLGLATTDSKTASVLAGTIGLKTLAEKHATLLYRYAAALAIEEGAVIVPGGAGADKLWTGLAGASPREPAKFLRVLLEKDNGQLLAYFSSLAQLDLPHQKFFTAGGKRAAAFYDLFKESPEMARGAGTLLRDGPFTEMLREVPLDENGSLSFPGSPEVWMVARGTGSTASTSKRIRKLSKVVAPEVEDEVLLRLAHQRYKADKERRSELDNFLAVVRIDAHRAEPLDEASALLLSESYARNPGLYAYFAVLTGLARTDFESLFKWAEKLRGSGDRLRLNMILGQWHALMESICLARQNGHITEEQSTALFRSLMVRFQSAAAPGEFVSASLDTLRALLKAANGGTEPDQALRELLIGKPRPLEFELDGKTIHLVAGEQQLAGYDRVLEMQKITRLGTLFRIESACGQLVSGNGAAGPLVKAIDEQRGLVFHVPLPKGVKTVGKQKDNLESYRPESLDSLVAKLREKAAKKKVNQKDIAKLAREVLDVIEPQVRLALAGPIYAYFLRPDDLLAEDPLLVRKHEFVSLSEGDWILFPVSYVEGSSEGAGRYATGGFAEFSRTAGQMAASGVRGGDSNSASVIAAEIGAVRMTDYSQLRDEDLQLLGLQVRAGREWIVGAAVDTALRRSLLDRTQGFLSLTRRRTLVSALDARDWSTVWGSITLSELYHLGRKLPDPVAENAALRSPVLVALRQAAAGNDGSRLDLLGGALPESYNCSHPHLLEQPPYEEFEQYLMPTRIAERVAEFKLYLADAAASRGIPAAALGVLSEPALREVVKRIHMADLRDWRSVIAALSGVNGALISEVLDRQ